VQLTSRLRIHQFVYMRSLLLLTGAGATSGLAGGKGTVRRRGINGGFQLRSWTEARCRPLRWPKGWS